MLERLREIGVALALDDFGTWYSSLGTLGELPIEAVKLDRTFVRGVGSDLENDTIVSSVIELAHAHGVRVVAEGVESWAEGARLCELGCDRALGYLFSGPQRAEQARSMLLHGTGWSGAGRMPSPRTPTLNA
jgi:diguanylate cyclase